MHTVGRYFLSILLALVACTPAFCAPQKNGSVCTFPAGQSLGIVRFADPDNPYHSRPGALHTQARGRVQVPEDKLVVLKLNNTSRASLEALNNCGCAVSILWMNNTEFTDADVRYVLPLTQLRSIHLNNTEITDKGIAALAKLPSLEYLSVHVTAVTGATLGAIKNLRYLDAIRADVTDSGLQSLRGKDLRYLRLSKTPITDKTLATISGASNLYELHLDTTKITGASMPVIARFKKLENLHLGRLPLDDASLALLKNLPLKTLSLSGTKVTDATFAPKQHAFRSVENLRLADTKITDKGLAYISQLPNLKTLSLQGSAVTAPAVERFRAEHVDVRISSDF